MLNQTDMLDLLPAGIYRTTCDGKFEYANQALADLLGYASPMALLQANARHLYVDQTDRDEWLREFESGSNSIVTREFAWRRLGGETVRVVDASRVIREGNKIIAFEGVVHDLSKWPIQPEIIAKRDAEEFGYRRSEKIHDALIDFLPVCVIRKSRDRKFALVNDKFCELEGVTKKEVLQSRNTDALMYDSEVDEQYRRTDEAVFQTRQAQKSKEKHRYADHRLREVQVMKIPLFSKTSDDVIGLEVYYWDHESLADQYRDHQQARLIEQLFSTPDATAIYEHDFEGVFRYLSPAALVLLGLKTMPEGFRIQNTVAEEFQEIAKSQIRAKSQHTGTAMKLTTYEIDIIGANRRRIPVEVNSRMLLREGRPYGIIGYVRDLSKEKRRLREVNHRVKNNLQTVISLLDRDSPAASDTTRSVLLDCKSRIYAIADLHEELYKTNRTDQVEVHSFLNRLIDKVVVTYKRPWQDIDVRKFVDNSSVLSLDAMVPLVLIVQELVSNVLKHAFPERKDRITRGTLLVSFSSRRDKDNEYYLQVTDTGIGLPADFRLESAKSLGMRLVFGLVTHQLRGKVEIPTSTHGAFFKIEFSDPSPIVQTQGTLQ